MLEGEEEMWCPVRVQPSPCCVMGNCGDAGNI